MVEPDKKDECPLCSCSVPVVLLNSHVNSHLDDEEFARDRVLAQQITSTSNKEDEDHHGGKRRSSHHAVRCDKGCSQDVLIKEWDSHCLQHKLTFEAVDETSERGFSSKRARIVKPWADNLRILVGCQMKDTNTPIKEGLMHLLQRCLESDQRAGSSTVALAGYVEHYESRHREDLGWGCGWRNIQMLASHLLAQDLDAKRVLFAGCGYVPDISALQRWLEITWSKGFDAPGAEYFNWEILGTHKWIGTTECAALLRSFGMRARIVDFQAFGPGQSKERVGQRDQKKSSSPDSNQPTRNSFSSKSSGSSRASSPVETEEGECTGCGEYPIHGIRYRHTDITDSDLCVSCMEKLRNSCNNLDRDVAEGYRGIELGGGAGGSGTSSSHHADDANSHEVSVKHQHIVDWVWNYFTDRFNRSSSSSSYNRIWQPIILSRKSPLYFQHRGHSRTIVGIERRRRPGVSEEVYLIVLDPSQRTEDIAKALRERSGWQKLLKRGLHTLKQAEYQLCYVDNGVASGEEYEGLKVLSSVHYTY